MTTQHAWLAWMQPRDHQQANRLVSVLALVAVAVTTAFLPFNEREATRTQPGLVAVVLIVLAVMAVMSIAARYFGARQWAWAACPFLAISAIVVADLATYDASVSAQIFFLFPVFYAASLLPRHGAGLVTAACVVGEVIVVLMNLPFQPAITDAGFMSAVLVTTAVMMVRAAETQARLMAAMAKLASTDALTGLVNRRVFDQAAADALSPAGSEEGTSLILLDVDLFKSVNDRFGHPGGDQVLIQLADLLVAAARKGDVVSRLGGDEMALLMPACSVEVAQRRAQEIVEGVRQHGFAVSVGEVINVSVSAGVAHAPTDASDMQRLYVAADTALYQAKESGRDQVVAHAAAAVAVLDTEQPGDLAAAG